MKFYIWAFFENLSRKFKFNWNRTRITGTLHVDQYTLLIMCRTFLLRIKNISDKRYRLLCSIFFFLENHVVYEIMWKNVVERGKPQMRLWRMRIACWIPKATNTHSGCIILIAFPTATMVARTHLNVTLYVHCLSCLKIAELTDAYNWNDSLTFLCWNMYHNKVNIFGKLLNL
jgi:hypothetical protein